MSTVEVVLRVMAGLLLVAANAFFVVVEFSLTRLRQFDRAEIEGDAGLELAWEMTQELEIYLTGCQLGISTASVLLGVVAEPALTHVIRPGLTMVGLGAAAPTASIVIAVVIIQLVHKVWGEQAPTYLGVERPLVAARVCARPLYYWVRATHPVIVAGDGLAKWTLRLFGVEMTRSWAEDEAMAAEGEGQPDDRHELRRRIIDALGRAHLDDERQEEVINTFDMDETEVADVMVPWDDATVVDVSLSFADNRRRMVEGGKTRYPVVDSDGEVLGAVYLQEVFGQLSQLEAGTQSLRSLVHEVPCLDPSLPVSDMVDELQDAQHELAFVCSNGENLGVVTVIDALETIFGAVRAPLDAEPDVEQGRTSQVGSST